MQHSGLRKPEKEEDATGKLAYLTIVSAKHRPTLLPGKCFDGVLPQFFYEQGTCIQA